MNTPRRRSRIGLWLSVLCLVLGAFSTYVVALNAAIYVPLCPSFTLDAPVLACRQLTQMIMAGEVVTLGGLLGCLWAGFQALRRFLASRPAHP